MRVPGLAERKEDLPELAARILSRFGAHVRLSDAAMQRLTEHDWPGNLRELENLLERAAAFSPDGRIDVTHLEFDESRPKAFERPRLAGYTMEQIERWALLDTLERVGGNKAAAARMLGLCEKTIYNKLKRLRARKRQAD